MWNKRQEEPPQPAPRLQMPPVAQPPVEVRKETIPVATNPFRAPESDARSTASIGKAVKINGQIFSKEDLYVDGDVEGTIELAENKLTIGPSGRVQAGIRAREVVVLGQIQGNVEAMDKLDIRKDAKLVGDIKTARIIIEDGAYFKGSIDIVKHDPGKKTGPVAGSPQNAPAVVAAISEVKR
jgi:cytoskeletal protein CcmA (bactofilin family)